MLERAHILRETSPHARGRFVSPLRVSLACNVCTQAVRIQTSAFLLAHLVGSFVSHASRASLVLWFLIMTKRARIGRKIFSSYVGLHFLLEPHQQRGAAEGATQNRAGIPVHASHAPGVRRRAVRADRFLICAAFFLSAPRPAPGCRPAIRKKPAASSPVYFPFFSENEATSK